VPSPVIVSHGSLVCVVEGGLVIAMVKDPVIEASAELVVVASSAPRTDMIDACDCKA
jgi:hypothetical protein